MRIIKIKDHCFYAGYDNKNISLIIICEDKHLKSIERIIQDNANEDMAYEIILNTISKNYPTAKIITFESDDSFDRVFEV